VVAGGGSSVEVTSLFHSFELHGQTLSVLDGIDLSVESGEFVAILGPSGCGKSTLLRLIAGLDRPHSGRICMGGRQIDAPDPSRILVFQDPTLYPWRTVRKNVALGLQARGLQREQNWRIDAALQQVGLMGFDGAYPHQLSGGMAQRAALARALVNDPSVLLMDEPLANLDSLTRMAMQAVLIGLWQQAAFTAFLVTHDVEEALCLAGRVLVMSNRPARVLADVEVDMTYPRHRANPRFAELRQRLVEILGLRSQW
jgi:NitT/TauT family transport system ATP-binding protein